MAYLRGVKKYYDFNYMKNEGKREQLTILNLNDRLKIINDDEKKS